MQPNDINDLFLLLYVQPNDKLWTKETYWKRLIKEKIGLGHYLFEQ